MPPSWFPLPLSPFPVVRRGGGGCLLTSLPLLPHTQEERELLPPFLPCPCHTFLPSISSSHISSLLFYILHISSHHTHITLTLYPYILYLFSSSSHSLYTMFAGLSSSSPSPHHIYTFLYICLYLPVPCLPLLLYLHHAIFYHLHHHIYATTATTYTPCLLYTLHTIGTTLWFGRFVSFLFWDTFYLPFSLLPLHCLFPSAFSTACLLPYMPVYMYTLCGFNGTFFLPAAHSVSVSLFYIYVLLLLGLDWTVWFTARI